MPSCNSPLVVLLIADYFLMLLKLILFLFYQIFCQYHSNLGHNPPIALFPYWTRILGVLSVAPGPKGNQSLKSSNKTVNGCHPCPQ